MVSQISLRWRAKKAFTMIELIFAIVVIGVTLLTVPLMIETNNKALERNMAQEAIFLAAALISVESTDAWDTNSIVATGNPDDYVLAKILDTSAVNTTYGRVALGVAPAQINTNVRRGGILADKHRQFFDFNTTAGAPNGGFSPPAQGGIVNYVLPIDNAVAAATDYKEAYNNTARRLYVADGSNGTDVFSTAATGVSNLKMIEVTVPLATSAEGMQVVLRAYTANIGEADYAKRSF